MNTIWQQVYAVLVEECGANPDEAREFLWRMAEYERSQSEFHSFPFEDRFKGSLEHGGKFHRENRDRKWYVTCYRENETPERLEMIEKANTRLEELRAQYVEAAE